MRYLYLFLACLSITLQAQIIGDIETGKASVFDDKYIGSETAYGATYNPNQLVAAHKTYPYDSRVVVRNLDNNREVEVRIIDEGPFIHGRIIEVSQAAADRLGMSSRTTTNVQLRLVATPDGRRTRRELDVSEAPARPAPAPTPVERQPEPAAPTTFNRTPTITEQPPAPNREVQAQERTTTNRATNPPAGEAVTQGQFGPGIYSLAINQGPTAGFGVQVASLSSLESAMDKTIELQGRFFDNILLRRVGSGPLATYKIILGPWPSREAADSYKADLKRRYSIEGFVVPLAQ